MLDSGLREYLIDTSSNTYLNSVYRRSCNASRKVKSSALGVGLDAVVKTIPTSFTGNVSSNSEAMQNFCSSYDSETVNLSDRSLYQERIIQRGYDSFDQCLIIASQGVVVTHTVRGLEDMDFYVAPGFGRPVTIRGVQTSQHILCTGIAGDNQEYIEFNEKTQVRVHGDTSLSIGCKRTSTTGEIGEEVFAEGAVTLFTNVGRNGNYGAYWPRDVRLPDSTASDIQDALRDLALASEEQASLISGIGASSEPGKVTQERRGYIPPGGKWSNTGGVNWVSCPDGHYVAAVGGYDSDPGGQCSHCVSEIGIQCLPLHENAGEEE